MATANDTRETTFSTPSDREIAIERTFDAPRELVWAAFTEPRHLQQWLLGPDGWSMPVCELDLRDGGAWHFVWRKDDDGEEMEMTGVYKEVTPPERYVNTESWGGDWPETLNTVTFAGDGDRTTVTTTVLYPSREARDAARATGMEGGVGTSYERLARLLTTLA